MPRPSSRRRDVDKVADIVRDAGGTIVGRTRLQKIAYLLEVTGLGEGFGFGYRHYGPYSEELTVAVRNARLLGLLSEEEKSATWGGYYSVFSAVGASSPAPLPARAQLIAETVDADPVDLELAATAIFLALDGYADPWSETARRKPEKAESLVGAKALYRKLIAIKSPIRVPTIE